MASLDTTYAPTQDGICCIFLCHTQPALLNLAINCHPSQWAKSAQQFLSKIMGVYVKRVLFNQFWDSQMQQKTSSIPHILLLDGIVNYLQQGEKTHAKVLIQGPRFIQKRSKSFKFIPHMSTMHKVVPPNDVRWFINLMNCRTLYIQRERYLPGSTKFNRLVQGKFFMGINVFSYEMQGVHGFPLFFPIMEGFHCFPLFSVVFNMRKKGFP